MDQQTPETGHPTGPPTGPATSRDRTVRHCQGLNELLDRRRDLAGVVAMADLIRDSTSWAA